MSTALDAKALVFDFDGTLVDSNAIKRQAFDICFADFPDHLSKIRDYCHINNHTPRWEKFHYVYEHILKLPYTPDIEAQLHRAYADATSRQVAAAPEIPGAQAFLESVYQRFPLALLSSTPHDILLWILDQRHWRHYFKFVQGAPVHKADWLREFSRLQGFPRDHLLFFGDTPEDAEASRQAGCPFIRIDSANQWTSLPPW